MDERITEVNSHCKQLINDIFVDFNKSLLGLTPKSHPKYRFRNSFLYRIESCPFHLSLLEKMNIWWQNEIARSTEKAPLLYSASREIYFIFDDLIFNLSSLFDYIGNFIGYIYLGESKSQIKWKGLLGHSCNNSNEKIPLELRNFIKVLNRQYVDHLYGYRSDIIHYVNDGSKVQFTTSVTKEYELNMLKITVPEKFIKKMKFYTFNFDDDICVNANQLLLLLYTKINELLGIIARDIIPKTKERMNAIVQEFKKTII